MKDRTINVDIISSSSTQLSRPFYNPHNYPAVNSTGGRYTHKRVPCGGPPGSFRDEKPFLNSSLRYYYPSGQVQFKDAQGHIYRYTGQGSYSHQGKLARLDVDLGFPPDRNRNPNPIHYGHLAIGVNPDLLSQAEVKALNKLRDKSGQSDLDFGLWYGERRETAQLFAQGAVGILNLARSIAQKDYRKSAEVLRDVFRVPATAKAERQRVKRLERWLRKEVRNGKKVANRTLKSVEDAALTYNLGISPLVKDLQTVHQRLLTGDLTSKTAIKAVAKHSQHTEGSQTVVVDDTGCSNTVSFVLDHGYTVTLVAVPSFTDRARMSRLGLTNPANTMYQLTGLTFLLDYFVNLGPFLESLNTPMEFEFVQGSRTQRVVRNMTQTVKSSLGKMTDGRSIFNHTERKLYTKFPVPIPPLSRRGRDLSVTQATNAGLIALKSFRALLGLK